MESVFFNEMNDPYGEIQVKKSQQSSKKFACTKCSSTFGKKQTLQRHVKFECNMDPKYKCPYCNRLFKKSSNAYTHVRRQHSNFEVYIIDLRSGEDAKVFRVPKSTPK